MQVHVWTTTQNFPRLGTDENTKNNQDSAATSCDATLVASVSFIFIEIVILIYKSQNNQCDRKNQQNFPYPKTFLGF